MSAGVFTLWLVEALIASTLLMTLVLLVRGPVRSAFGPRIAYALWALPLFRFLLPPLPSGWGESATTPITRAGETITVLVIDSAGSAAAAPVTSAPSLGFPLWLWALGAAAFLLFHLVRHARFCRRILRSACSSEEVEGVTVLTSAAAPGPLAFGLWRRYVAFPRDFAERYDADERSLALAHEIGHHERGDLLANWAALAVLALHWFNPLAWRAFRAFRADQELANDARVLAGRSPTLRHAYGRAIVKAAHGGAVSAACHLHTIDDLKGRLKMLSRSPASHRRLRTGAVAVGATILAGLGLTASGSRATAALTARVGHVVGAELQLPALPAPQAPSAPDAAPAPPAVPAPPAPGKGGHKRVVIGRDGRATTYEGPEADAYLAANPAPVPPVPPAPPTVARLDVLHASRTETPDVRQARCAGPDDAQPLVESRSKRDKQRIVICTNRIEATVRSAERMADAAHVTERQARTSARLSLRMARAAIERERTMSEEQKKDALAGIAEAEKELSADAG